MKLSVVSQPKSRGDTPNTSSYSIGTENGEPQDSYIPRIEAMAKKVLGDSIVNLYNPGMGYLFVIVEEGTSSGALRQEWRDFVGWLRVAFDE